MSSVPTAPPAAALPPETSLPAALLSYCIPGLGQIYQGRYGKGLLFMVSLLGMFFLGQAMGNWQNVYLPRPADGPNNLMNSLITRWHYAGQFWIGAAAWPALWQYFGMTVPSQETQPFWHNFQREPIEGQVDQEGTVNYFLVNSNKTADLGWVYTVIAGMLNLLVIYDAFAGAALAPLGRPEGQAPVVPKPEGMA